MRGWSWPELTPAGHGGSTVADVESAVFNPGGESIWLINSRKELHVWSYDSGEMRAMFRTGAGEQKEARFNLDLRRVVTQDGEHVVRVWEAASGAQIGQPIALKESDGFDVSRNGETLYVLHEDNRVELFSIATGQPFGAPSTPESIPFAECL